MPPKACSGERLAYVAGSAEAVSGAKKKEIADNAPTGGDDAGIFTSLPSSTLLDDTRNLATVLTSAARMAVPRALNHLPKHPASALASVMMARASLLPALRDVLNASACLALVAECTSGGSAAPQLAFVDSRMDGETQWSVMRNANIHLLRGALAATTHRLWRLILSSSAAADRSGAHVLAMKDTSGELCIGCSLSTAQHGLSKYRHCKRCVHEGAAI